MTNDPKPVCRRLKFIKCRTGVWKCLRGLPPDPSPSTGYNFWTHGCTIFIQYWAGVWQPFRESAQFFPVPALDKCLSPILGHFFLVLGRGQSIFLPSFFPIFSFRPVFHSRPGCLTRKDVRVSFCTPNSHRVIDCGLPEIVMRPFFLGLPAACTFFFENKARVAMVRFGSGSCVFRSTGVVHNLVFPTAGKKEKMPFLGISCLFSCVWGKKGQGKNRAQHALRPARRHGTVTQLLRRFWSSLSKEGDVALSWRSGCHGTIADKHCTSHGCVESPPFRYPPLESPRNFFSLLLEGHGGWSRRGRGKRRSSQKATQ